MVYDAIIRGSTGIFFFGGGLDLNNKDQPYGWNWSFWQSVLRPVVREIGRYSPIYQALGGPNVTASLRLTSNDTAVATLARSDSQDRFIFAANSKPFGRIAKFTVASCGGGPIYVLFEGSIARTIQCLEDRSFVDSFTPYQVHVYKMTG